MTYRQIFRVDGIPVCQNRMYGDQATALECPLGNIVLVQDMHWGFVFNKEYDSNILLYNEDYQNEQSCSAVFQRHLGDVIRIIGRHLCDKKIVEIGCGKGDLLRRLLELSFSISGIDPAYEGAALPITKKKFEASDVRDADGFILRHVLEHIPDPISFLNVLAKASAGGLVYIEVPSFDWICSRRAWFDIYYEHVNYFRLADLIGMFEKVVEAGYLFEGQYIYIVADLDSFRLQGYPYPDQVDFPKDFMRNLHAALSSLSYHSRRAIWGAAAKGMIFAFYAKLFGQQIDFVIDINPAKQGRFLAGSGLSVSAPAEVMRKLEPGDYILVMNSNYLDEIKEAVGNQFNYVTVDKSVIRGKSD